MPAPRSSSASCCIDPMAFARPPNPVFSEAYLRLRGVLIGARRSAGVSQRQLARRIGKSSTHICMIERGQRRVDVLEFARIARALGADPLALYAAALPPEAIPPAEA